MPKPYVNPLGYIDQLTKDGAVFTLNNLDDSLTLRTGTVVTV